MIDHLVVAVPDLQIARATAIEQWGVTPIPGGAHVGHGTRNELLGLGDGTYLELIGPDEDQPDHIGPRPFGVDGITGPTLLTWCARPPMALDDVATAMAADGHDVGPIQAMSRRRPDGVLLTWDLSMPGGDPTIPFIVDWGASEHPSASLPNELRLIELRLEHPHPVTLRRVLEAGQVLDPRIAIVEAAAPAVSATIDAPNGPLTL